MSGHAGRAAPERARTLAAASGQLTATRRPLVQRRCACGGTPGPSGECAACRRERLKLQRVLRSPGTAQQLGEPSAAAPPIVHQALRSPGQPLDPATRGFMESRLGHDLGRVRIHTDGRAATSARAVSARAYAVGSDVVFAAGEYAPATRAGLGLLAHELTHTLQQGGHQPSASGSTVQRRLEIGAGDDPVERQADRVARTITAGAAAPMPRATGRTAVQRTPGPPVLRRQPATPQPRGGQARKAKLDQPPRGDDEVRIHVWRYLCHCRGENVTRTSLFTRTQPNPGVTFRFCRGRTTVGITGDVVPSGFATGSVRAGVEFNVAPAGGTGVRVRAEGEARNTGSEPQVGGRVTGTVEPPGGPRVGASGSILRGTQTGQIETEVTVVVEGPLGVTFFGGVTNPQEQLGVLGGLGGTFGSPPVQRELCRECRCPVVYDCVEDIPPRSFEKEVEFEVEDETSLRYYFSLNSNRDARDAGLRAESGRTLDRLTQLVAVGASIVSITGHASPEADQEGLNQELSETRGRRLRELIAARLGPDVTLPEPGGGGELLGSRATILPGSGLENAILASGFDGPEDVSTFLIGEEIENDELASQFLALLNRVTDPTERLRLFGVDAASPVAAQLLAAIDRFIAGGGRGRRPWDRIFEFLRVATVKVSQTRTETRTETRTTGESLRPVGEAQCNRYAQQAEDEGLFGPAEARPTEANCPTGEPTNAERLGERCDYKK